jgi:hypothetical protein
LEHCCGQVGQSTVLVSRQKITLDDAIGSHACSREALEACDHQYHSSQVFTPLHLPVGTVNSVQTLKGFEDIIKQDLAQRERHPCLALNDFLMFELPGFELAAAHAVGGQSTHMYEWQYNGNENTRFGAYHSVELGLVFGGVQPEDEYCTWYGARFPQKFLLRMPLSFTPLLHLKLLLHACDQ